MKTQAQENSLTCVIHNRLVIANGPALFSEIVKLILIMPATNALSEQSFSALRRIKNYLGSTVMQKRMNNLMVMSVYKEDVGNLNDQLDLRPIRFWTSEIRNQGNP